MIISVNWLKKYTSIDLPIDELATLIGARLVEIEETVEFGTKYDDVIVAKVMECTPLEESDHLNVTKIDDGGKASDVERDVNGYVQVVCGAPNVREGMVVAWLPPGSTVPETHGGGEPFVLGARKLRGAMSNGMLASARELALFDEHKGILELDGDLVPGASFAEAYELDDTLLDIENKSLTHRPDTFGIIGFAREVAAIQGKQFNTPAWLKSSEVTFTDGTGRYEMPSVTVDDPELSARYQAVIVDGLEDVKDAPLNVQAHLGRIGVRPIGGIVDVTNYLMMVTGQPLHAFDYDKLLAVGDGKIDIHVRAGRPGETLVLLDGREIELTPDDIVIANGETAVALAGAMGGRDTEVDDSTKVVLLESATFNLYNLRATQMRHGIFSEAITRFTKGQPAGLTAPVLGEVIRMLEELGGTQASGVADDYPGKQERVRLHIEDTQVNAILGSQLSVDEIATHLSHAEFDVARAGEGQLRIDVPYWRSDIHIREDLVEEIGRIYGFDTITPTLPRRDFTAIRPGDFDTLRSRLRSALVKAGGNEVLTYSFVHGDTLVKAGQKSEDSYRITNSISPALQYYRQSLTPSLLGHVHTNLKQGYDDFALFELNKVHPKTAGLTGENVPTELDALALVVAKKLGEGASYYLAKHLLDYVMKQFGVEPEYVMMESHPNTPEAAPFEFRRAALIRDRKSGTHLGIVGEYKKSVTRAFKLSDYAAGFELDVRALFDAINTQASNGYRPLSRYPSTERDICFQVQEAVVYQQVVDASSEVSFDDGLEVVVSPVDIYQPLEGKAKNITIRLVITPYNKTLTGDETAAIIQQVIDSVVSHTGATVI
jgi:phenylalanyl-tRNA synthetase beta chain